MPEWRRVSESHGCGVARCRSSSSSETGRRSTRPVMTSGVILMIRLRLPAAQAKGLSLTPQVVDVLRLLHRFGLTSSDHAPPSPHNFVERIHFEGNCVRIRKLGERTANRCPKEDSLVMECICHRRHSWPMSAVPGHAANARSSEELQALGHGQRPEAVEVTHRSLRVTCRPPSTSGPTRRLTSHAA
jgi:hypothetical protein